MAEATQEIVKPVEVEATPEKTIETLGKTALALVQAQQELAKQGIQLASYEYEERTGEGPTAGVLFQKMRKGPYHIDFRDGELLQIHGPSGIKERPYFNLWMEKKGPDASVTDGRGSTEVLELEQALPTIKGIIGEILTKSPEPKKA